MELENTNQQLSFIYSDLLINLELVKYKKSHN